MIISGMCIFSLSLIPLPMFTVVNKNLDDNLLGDGKGVPEDDTDELDSQE